MKARGVFSCKVMAHEGKVMLLLSALQFYVALKCSCTEKTNIGCNVCGKKVVGDLNFFKSQFKCVFSYYCSVSLASYKLTFHCLFI